MINCHINQSIRNNLEEEYAEFGKINLREARCVLNDLFKINVPIREIEIELDAYQYCYLAEIPDHFFLKDKIVKLTFKSVSYSNLKNLKIWDKVPDWRYKNYSKRQRNKTRRVKSVISLLSPISMILNSLSNLQTLNFEFHKCNQDNFYSVIDVMKSYPFEVNATLGRYPKTRGWYVKIENGLLLFNIYDKFNVVKAKAISFVLEPKSKIYDSDSTIFSFSDCTLLKIKRARLLNDDHPQYNTFMISLKNYKRRCLEEYTFYAVMNSNFKILELDNYFKTLLPSPKNAEIIKIFMRSEWNKWQINKYISFLESIDKWTIIKLFTISSDNNIEKLNLSLSKLSFQEICFNHSFPNNKIEVYREIIKAQLDKPTLKILKVGCNYNFFIYSGYITNESRQRIKEYVESNDFWVKKIERWFTDYISIY